MAGSMTGFGRGEVKAGERHFVVEIKSVNNRYLDINIRMPRRLNPYEAQVRSCLKQSIQRGKVDVYITLEEPAGTGARVYYNRELAGEYLGKLREMAADYGLSPEISAEELSRFPDVLTIMDEDGGEEDLWEPLGEALLQALDQFMAAREKEGAFITQDLLSKLDDMEGDIGFLETNASAIEAAYRVGLYEKMREVLADTRIDENRILQEAALYSEKVCIDEELVRLHSHIGAVRGELRKEKESVGRKLDFLAQEMNREANTILSKTSSAESADRAINLKTSVEKIREQIQNLE